MLKTLLSSLLCLLGCLTGISLSAQSLNWVAQNIITDTQQSGANPAMEMDAGGNLHVTFWRDTDDRLIYARRDYASRSWTYEPLTTPGTFGYESALTLGADGRVHVAFLQNAGGLAGLRYARRDLDGSWTVEALPVSNHLGAYGQSLNMPSYVQHSVDIHLLASGQPAVAFFDGEIRSSAPCASARNRFAPSDYDLELQVVVRQADGSWLSQPLPDVPNKNLSGCLADGDRFGEFCQFFSLPGNRTYLLTTSFYNHEVLWFNTTDPELGSWTYEVADSTDRVFNFLDDRHHGETFQFVDGDLTGDSLVHLAYSISDYYGFGFPFTNRQPYLYARFHPDSLARPGYEPYYFQFGPADRLRSQFTLTAAGPDTVFLFFYDGANDQVRLQTSVTAGQFWNESVVADIRTSATMHSALYADSLYLLVYDRAGDYLQLLVRHRNGGAWRFEDASINELRGESLSSYVRRVGNDDEINLAFSEAQSGQVFWGEKVGGNWTFEPVSEAGEDAYYTSLAETVSGPVVAYVLEEVGELWVADRSGGTWTSYLVDDAAQPRDPVLRIARDSLHLCYYDAVGGQLKYARAAQTAGPWALSVLDSSSAIVGQRPAMVVDSSGALHISYSDGLNATLKYARRDLSGNWSVEAVTVPLNFNPALSDIELYSDGQPAILFRDATANSIFLAEKASGGSWTVENVLSEGANLLGFPLDLGISPGDRPWAVFNFSSLSDEVRIARRDDAGNWEQLLVNNNSFELANSFDFHFVENDLYLIGRKNQVNNQGLGLLFAEEGLILSPEAPETPFSLRLFPQPSPETGGASL
jgi:hypothetical protein